MLSLNLPSYSPNVSQKNGKYVIFDPIRRKHVALTPEEWVRQHFVNYLLSEKEYPASLIANEVAISMNGLSKRCDTVVYSHFLEPLVVIEYKAPSVPITQHVFEQIARYNISLRVQFLIVSNGLQHYCCEIDYTNQTYNYLEDIPFYNSLVQNIENS